MEPTIVTGISNIWRKKGWPIIKVKRNSIISSKRITRYGEFRSWISNKEDYHKWKKKRKYGQR
jgi:hypothetical protein